jgi:hypothetical protein
MCIYKPLTADIQILLGIIYKGRIPYVEVVSSVCDLVSASKPLDRFF